VPNATGRRAHRVVAANAQAALGSGPVAATVEMSTIAPDGRTGATGSYQIVTGHRAVPPARDGLKAV